MFLLEKSDRLPASVMPIFASTVTYTTQRSFWRSCLASLLNHRGAHKPTIFDFCPGTLETFLANLLGTLTRVAPRQAPLNPTLRVF